MLFLHFLLKTCFLAQKHFISFKNKYKRDSSNLKLTKTKKDFHEDTSTDIFTHQGIVISYLYAIP